MHHEFWQLDSKRVLEQISHLHLYRVLRRIHRRRLHHFLPGWLFSSLKFRFSWVLIFWYSFCFFSVWTFYVSYRLPFVSSLFLCAYFHAKPFAYPCPPFVSQTSALKSTHVQFPANFPNTFDLLHLPLNPSDLICPCPIQLLLHCHYFPLRMIRHFSPSHHRMIHPCRFHFHFQFEVWIFVLWYVLGLPLSEFFVLEKLGLVLALARVEALLFLLLLLLHLILPVYPCHPPPPPLQVLPVY
mmetsp:Transcript_18616/g.21498  ORF Transcript_18616/g.21498 Transcript_18616/m.21498 type:complete len:241 (+) Transcript_18616:1722-2444(+)